jgi:hypothetical protein
LSRVRLSHYARKGFYNAGVGGSEHEYPPTPEKEAPQKRASIITPDEQPR